MFARQRNPFSLVDLQQDPVRYFADRVDARHDFGGQTTSSFQAALATMHENVTRSDCDIYHTFEACDGVVHQGQWDLRGHEGPYLGLCPFDGRRVIEFGPASGGLSRHMTREGARLTVFDLPIGAGPEFAAPLEFGLGSTREGAAAAVNRLRNGWWFTRRETGFEATAVYGDIYALPSDLGRFDVAVLGSLLLHLSNPFRALQSAASVTDGTIIVTDVVPADLNGLDPDRTGGTMPLGVFNPTAPPAGLVHWWALSPAAVGRMLDVLGFTERTLSFHRPSRMAASPSMVTIVARRPPG